MTQATKDALDDYTNTYLVGWFQSRADGFQGYNINVQEPNNGPRNANIGVLAMQEWHDWTNPDDDDPIPMNTFLGAKMNADMVGIGSVNNEPYTNMDMYIPAGKTYTFSTDKSPYHWKPYSDVYFYNVKDYGAKGDGALVAGSDDTDEIQAALAAAGSTGGGGVVYLPPGQYVVSRPLTIPPGVELRGCSDYYDYSDNCVLLACCGAPGVDSYGSDPFITLESDGYNGSGVSGFSIVYPVQGYADSNYSASPQNLPQVEPYPPTIRGGGNRVWVRDMKPVNAYDFIDFSSVQCNEHLISGVMGAAFNNNITIGGGSEYGIVERSNCTAPIFYQYTPRACSPADCALFAQEAAHLYIESHFIVYKIGTCWNETGFGLSECQANANLKFIDDTGVGCQNGNFWFIGTDVCNLPGASVDCQKGGDISLFWVMYNRGTAAPWVRTGTNFTGVLNMYTGHSSEFLQADSNTWDINGGTVNVYCEKPVSYGRPVWANNQIWIGWAAEYVNDGVTFPYSQWVADTKDTNPPSYTDPDAYWVRVDLGQPCDIARWALYHAPFLGDLAYYATGDALFDTSTDGVNWTQQTVMDIVPPAYYPYCNTWEGPIDRAIPGKTAYARYVRLRVPQGTRDGAPDNNARIPEFMAYALKEQAGWQFTDTTTSYEGWTATGFNTMTIESFGDPGVPGNPLYPPDSPYGYTKRLKLTTSAANPYVTSGDHLSINSYRYNAVKIKLMTYTSSCTSLKLQWTTQCDTVWNTVKQKTVNVTAGSHNYIEYTLGSLPASWKGTIKQLRITFTGATAGAQIIKVASISLVDALAPVSNAGSYDSFTDYTDGLAASGGTLTNQGYHSQGYKGCWYYQDMTGSRTSDASYTTLTSKVYTTAFTNLTWEKSYAASYKLHVSDSWQRPVRYSGVNHGAVRKWVAPYAGTINISGTAQLQASQLGVYLYIMKRSVSTGTWTILWSGTLSGTGIQYPAVTDESVEAGDVISFLVEPNTTTNSQNYKTNWSQTIQYR